jgi:hypothetical protein
MKKLIPIILCILISTLAYATPSIFIKDSIDEGQSKAYEVDDGWYILTLTIVSDSKGVAKFKLNEETSTSLKERDSFEFKDGSTIIIRSLDAIGGFDNVDYYFYASGISPLDIEPETDIALELCNFDKECSETETQEDCCYDCGCETGFRCTDNACEEIIGCIEDEECNDDNACSEDFCTDSQCSNEFTNGCNYNETCFETGSNKLIEKTISYCLNGWHTKKILGDPCENSFECTTGECKGNVCYKKKTGLINILLTVIIFLSAIIFILRLRKSEKKNFKKKFKF